VKVLSTIDGRHLAATETAAREFRAVGLSPEDYIITLIEGSADTVIVVFTGRDRPRGFRGSPPGLPGYEVVVAVKTGEVVRKNFVR